MNEEDLAAFEQFFRGSYRSLLRELIYLGGHPEEAEDALAAGMEAALKNWPRIESPRAYVRRAAFNHLIKGRQRGQRRIEDRMQERRTVDADPAPGQVLWEQQEWVKELLEQLTPAQREVVACVFDALTPQEIGQLLGKSPEAVRQSLRAARKRLRNYLDGMDGEEG
jgi:RNA polymerase sigma factor (sigma-70 family)